MKSLRIFFLLWVPALGAMDFSCEQFLESSMGNTSELRQALDSLVSKMLEESARDPDTWRFMQHISEGEWELAAQLDLGSTGQMFQNAHALLKVLPNEELEYFQSSIREGLNNSGLRKSNLRQIINEQSVIFPRDYVFRNIFSDAVIVNDIWEIKNYSKNENYFLFSLKNKTGTYNEVEWFLINSKNEQLKKLKIIGSGMYLPELNLIVAFDSSKNEISIQNPFQESIMDSFDVVSSGVRNAAAEGLSEILGVHVSTLGSEEISFVGFSKKENTILFRSGINIDQHDSTVQTLRTYVDPSGREYKILLLNPGADLLAERSSPKARISGVEWDDNLVLKILVQNTRSHPIKYQYTEDVRHLATLDLKNLLLKQRQRIRKQETLQGEADKGIEYFLPWPRVNPEPLSPWALVGTHLYSLEEKNLRFPKGHWRVSRSRIFKHFLFSVEADVNNSNLYLVIHDLNSTTDAPIIKNLLGANVAGYRLWSADGQYIAYVTNTSMSLESVSKWFYNQTQAVPEEFLSGSAPGNANLELSPLRGPTEIHVIEKSPGLNLADTPEESEVSIESIEAEKISFLSRIWNRLKNFTGSK